VALFVAVNKIVINKIVAKINVNIFFAVTVCILAYFTSNMLYAAPQTKNPRRPYANMPSPGPIQLAIVKSSRLVGAVLKHNFSHCRFSAHAHHPGGGYGGWFGLLGGGNFALYKDLLVGWGGIGSGGGENCGETTKLLDVSVLKPPLIVQDLTPNQHLAM
jgi:hypothetical protein